MINILRPKSYFHINRKYAENKLNAILKWIIFKPL